MEKTIQQLIRLVEVCGITSWWVLERTLHVPQEELKSIAQDIWGDTPLRRVKEAAWSEGTNPLLFT